MSKKKKLWKFWPYPLAILILLAGGGWYLKASKANVPIISAPFNLGGDKDQDNSVQNQTTEITFKNYGPAPDFAGITKWYNTPNNSPLTANDFKGKVTLVEFWTYSSINSMNTIPSLSKWQQYYKDQGLQIIGVHTPQYAFEKIPANLENFNRTHNVDFPVAVDTNYKTWAAYHNQFWPAIYLIDKDGNIVYTHYGESDYDVVEKAVRTVLGLEGQYSSPPQAPQDQANTPDINLGFAKQNGFGNTEKAGSNEQIYAYPKKLGDNKFALEGLWSFSQEAAVHSNGYARLKVNFDAAKVYLVAESKSPITIRVYVDGNLVKGVVVSDKQAYELYDSLAGGKHTLEIEIPDGGFQAYTFTFG